MVYRLQGVDLPRDAYQQAEVGTTLSFVVATTIQAIILFTYQKKSKISENRN